ncbi:alpha/beta hydrolase [Paenibacillus sp. N3/727]|uniref:alpha/beta hydrolase n=1 Tax=Paenibacillus sp. N3/727 TaxID=2925845 RepID=UPI001F52EBE0|nr:alpha/beta hydrolase [Paenibacillus sp. N3/727]UNK15905.1 alpha/beta hydrolase [Paenibacillus sp. N3/727]
MATNMEDLLKTQQKNRKASWRPKGFIQWLLIVLAGIALPVIIMMAYYIFYPSNLFNITSLLAFFALINPMFLLILTLIILFLAVLAFWKKAKIAQTILIPLVFLLLFLNVYPITSMLSYSKSKNVSVSIGSHFAIKNDISSIPMQDVVYGKTTNGIELKLDVWLAKQETEGALTPAIVKVHGGGWVEGDKNNNPYWNQWLNELGYTVFDVQYRMPPQAGWKDEVGDVKSVLGWVLENADTYKIDTRKINVMGDSAGGNLVMLAAYSMGNVALPPSTDVPDVPINAVINLYGPADMTQFYSNNPSPNYVQRVMEQYIGGSPSQFPDRYKMLSPIYYIREGTPPTITFLGTSDRIVPEEQAAILDKEMAENGVAHELYLLPASDHVFDEKPGSLSTQFAREKVKRFLQKYNK